MLIKRYKKTREFLRILLICIASLIFALNIRIFVNNGGLLPGGFSGVTLLIQKVCSEFFNFSISYTLVNLLLNLFPIIISFKYIGKKFTIYSCVVIILSSILVDILPAFVITYDILLICIFGGIINGFAVAICLKMGTSSGGTDFISIFLSERKGIDTWNYILAFNVLILIIAGLLFNFDIALYSIIFQFTSTQVIQVFYKHYQKDTLFIITNKPHEIYKLIRLNTRHGATLFKGIGLYEGTERNMIYSIVNSDDTQLLVTMIHSLDQKAFVNVVKSDFINGRFINRAND